MRRALLGSLVLALLLPLGSALAAGGRAPALPRLGAHSWGSLKLGMTPAQGRATGMVSRQADRCSGQLMLTKPYRPYGSLVWRGSGSDRHLQTILITSTSVRTGKAAHVGTTLRRLRRTYPGLSKVRHSGFVTGHYQGKGPDLYVAFVRRPHGVLTFQFAYGDRPTASSPVDLVIANREPAVYWGC